MNQKVFAVKLVHSLIFWFQVACLVYLLYANIAGDFNWFIFIPIGSILLNGLCLAFNKGRCPFTNLAERYGADSGSVTDIFLPDIVARNIFRVSAPLFIAELILLGIRYFCGI